MTAVDQGGRYWTNDNVCLVTLGEANGGQVQESVPSRAGKSKSLIR